MADNVTVDNGALTDFTVATDDIGGNQYQRIKVAYGADDAATMVQPSAPLPVALEPRPASTTVTQVAASATTVVLQASNTSRRFLTIYNDSTALLYVKLGATASTTSYTVKLGQDDYFELPQPCYTGTVDGIWASATGNAYVTEG